MGKRLQTVAAMACMKSFLMIFNFLMWISGIAILGLGIWIEVDLHKYMELSVKFCNNAAYILIGIGAIIIFICSFACCCTIKGQAVLLYVYGGTLGVILIMELAAGVSFFSCRSDIIGGFDKGLNQSILNYRHNSLDKNSNIDIIQTTLQCCGNRHYADWTELNPPIPLSCCKSDNCDTSDISEIYPKGCYDIVVNFLNSNIGIVAGAAIGIAFFPLLGIILSCCLANTINKAKYEQMD